MTEKPGKIYAAIVAIMREVGPLGKDKKAAKDGKSDSGLKYDYRSAEAVYNRVQPLLAVHGVFSVPRVVKSEYFHGQSKSGGAMHFASLDVEYTFFAEDGSNVVACVSATGMDSGDKATAKAMTVADRYALCQLFKIPYQLVDPETGSPEWAKPLMGGITLKDLNELKRTWIADSPELKGMAKADIQLAFLSFVRQYTGEDFDVQDWRQWKQSDLDQCLKALQPDPLTTGGKA